MINSKKYYFTTLVLFFLGFFLLLPRPTYSQNFDPSDLWDSDTEEEETLSEETEEGIQIEPDIPSSIFFNFNLINLPRYNEINKDNPYDPLGEIFFPAFDNLIQVHTQVRYTFWKRRISLNWNSSLYSLIENKNSSDIAFTSEQDFSLNELSLKINLGSIFTMGLGKINVAEGTAFLATPTDFLDRRPQLNDSSSFYRTRSLGSYQIQLGLTLGNWEWALAYLPLFNTVYHEFSRPYPDRNPYFGELWSRVSWQAENVKTKFLFFWNGYFQGGVNLSATLGDEVVLFFDAAGKSISRPKFSVYGEHDFDNSLVYSRYKFSEEYQYRGQGLIGMTYTPANLFTLSAEILADIGKENQYWDSYRNSLDTLEGIALELKNSTVPDLPPLAEEYLGHMKDALNYHNPFNFQPIYLGLSISRSDAFSDFTAQIWNFETRLIYSPLDTSFFWMNNIVWQAPEAVNLGLFTNWGFGKQNGVFTSIPQIFSVGVVTQIYF